MRQDGIILRFNPHNIWDMKKLAIIRRLEEVFYMDTLNELELYTIATLQSERLKMERKSKEPYNPPGNSFV